jgi:site-specific DNA recombinase
MSQKALRCAIYTRKSTDEGLDQNFNSLDAQREACEAYIASQRHEGWKALSKRYDDGGYSGGNLQRPALQRLLEDINAGHVDLVLVYKIDRLTRSLTDFAKMVDVFDKRDTSFVSVTQHFNTTTSMGRLTLNVLLSFAQFEREVTGERIRDKIAASKAKGMWMGGPIPLGYDVQDGVLAINAKEAETVRMLFKRYQAFGCVQKLKAELDANGIGTKVRISNAGNRSGGQRFSRGALYHLLRNRLYCGEVHHAGKYYPGQHKAIVPQALWAAVQAQLDANHQAHKTRTRAKGASLLAGMVITESGQPLAASHTTRHGKRYRYYLLRPAAGSAAVKASLASIPAHDLEQLVEAEWRSLLKAKDLDDLLGIGDPDRGKAARQAAKDVVLGWDKASTSEKRKALMTCGVRVEIATNHINLHIDAAALRNQLLGSSDTTPPLGSSRLTRSITASLYRLRGEVRILGDDPTGAANATAEAREQVLRRVALGRKWTAELINGSVASMKELAVREKRAESYLYDVLRAGCLAPKIVEAVIAGRTLRYPDMDTFKESFPISWTEQATLVAL